jgi:uncharacterized protein (DUF2235 family)
MRAIEDKEKDNKYEREKIIDWKLINNRFAITINRSENSNIVSKSQRNRLAIVKNHIAIALRLEIATQSMRNLYSIDTKVQTKRYTITLQSQCSRYAIAA